LSALEAVLGRQSFPRVTGLAPSREELLPLVEAAATVADHGRLHPWRLIELRGTDRDQLGAAFVEARNSLGATALSDADAAALAAKPLRAPLLIAVVAVHHENVKVEAWEQDAAAAGVAHMVSLLLDDAGWGVFWRTGPLTRATAVHTVHGLAPNEVLLGWLYVGGKPDVAPPTRTAHIDPEKFLCGLADRR
jgi:nitroreductase